MAETTARLPALPFTMNRNKVAYHLGTLALFLGGWIMIFPFIWMVSSSLKPTDEVFDADRKSVV